MLIIKKSLLAFSFVLFGFSINAQESCEVLLIGSSYFNGNNLANLIKNLADSSNIPIYIEMHGQNGLYLADHAGSPSTEAKINEREWDYVVLQGVGVLVAYPDHFTHHPVYPALVTLRDKIAANCEETRMIFCMPWAFEDGMTWYQNWTDTYEDMQWHIYDTTLQWSDEIVFEIAPVGWAWYAVLEAYNYPLHYLHLSDWNHPSLRGSYLMACVIYSTIFQQTTVGIPYNPGIPQDEVDFYQMVASDTVLNNLELWNITPLVSVRENTGNIHFSLKQNYPNPFKASTRISYTLGKAADIQIFVYSAEGKVVAELINGIHFPGEHHVDFDASGLSKGTYICRMIAEESISTLIMILE